MHIPYLDSMSRLDLGTLMDVTLQRQIWSANDKAEQYLWKLHYIKTMIINNWNGKILVGCKKPLGSAWIILWVQFSFPSWYGLFREDLCKSDLQTKLNLSEILDIVFIKIHFFPLSTALAMWGWCGSYRNFFTLKNWLIFFLTWSVGWFRIM